MNLPKQSRPVTRDVSHDPLKEGRVEASQIQCAICNALPFPLALRVKRSSTARNDAVRQTTEGSARNPGTGTQPVPGPLAN
jgi:hypothetical protein